jgi:polysaccharide deacetylase family protein (PEP-CTERM system associated)
MRPTTHNEHSEAFNAPTNKLRATFFVLAWLADRLPHLIREMHARGHEVASHGCSHKLPNRLSQHDLKQDLTDSKKRLEDLLGSPVYGFRAPSFAINDDVLKIIEDCGYGFDSSYNSFSIHGRYGKISLNGNKKKGIAHILSEKFCELPISNLNLGNQILPWGGGAYFRLLPFYAFNRGIKAILKRQNAYVFYVHPWEIDPEQPRVQKAPIRLRFRHYSNLGKAHSRLKNLIASFNSCNFATCKEYLTSSAGLNLPN